MEISACWGRPYRYWCGIHLLFDVQSDPRQQRALQDAAVEQRLCAAMVAHFDACAAPPEQYARMAVPEPVRP